jgi:hypothetical protein
MSLSTQDKVVKDAQRGRPAGNRTDVDAAPAAEFVDAPGNIPGQAKSPATAEEIADVLVTDQPAQPQQP